MKIIKKRYKIIVEVKTIKENIDKVKYDLENLLLDYEVFAPLIISLKVLKIKELEDLGDWIEANNH